MNQRAILSNGGICGASLSDYIIVDTDILDTENPKDYKYINGEVVKSE
mgnify:CR=1 FL=1